MMWEYARPRYVDLLPFLAGLLGGVLLLGGRQTLLADGQAKTSTKYTISDIGAFEPKAINDGGDIVGDRRAKLGPNAVLLRRGRLIELGALGNAGYSSVSAINASGEIVGASNNRPCVWRSGKIRELPTPGYRYGSAVSMNDRGQIVGNVQRTSGGPSTACYWDKGGFHAIRHWKPQDDCKATGVNAQGTIVGNVYVAASGKQVGFTWSHGLMTLLNPYPDWIEPYRPAPCPIAINDLGQILGTCPQLEAITAYWWDRPRTKTPVDIWLTPRGFNNRGEVVGYVDPSGNQRWELLAVLWNGNDVRRLVNQVTKNDDWKLTDATAINDRGQIVGIGTHHGQPRGFLLTPVNHG